jgi:hypothetical protein
MTHYASTPNIITRLKGFDTTSELASSAMELGLEDADNYINRELAEADLIFTTSTPKELQKAAEFYACAMIVTNLSHTSSELPSSVDKWLKEADLSLHGYIKANENVEDNSPYQSSMTPANSAVDYDSQTDYDDEEDDFKEILDGGHY